MPLEESTREVVKHIQQVYSRTGYLYETNTDNGSCYSLEEIKGYLSQKEHKIKHVTNGLVEIMVQSVKSWWRKKRAYNLTLLMYRTTPLRSGREVEVEGKWKGKGSGREVEGKWC